MGGAAVFFPWRHRRAVGLYWFCRAILARRTGADPFVPLGRTPGSRDLSRPVNRRSRPATAFLEHASRVQAPIRDVDGRLDSGGFLGLCISRCPVFRAVPARFYLSTVDRVALAFGSIS